MREVDVFGIASCVAAADTGCSLGPGVLRSSSLLKRVTEQHHLQLHWGELISPDLCHSQEELVARVCARIKAITLEQIASGSPFLFFGGDHSCAMGIWSGVFEALGAGHDFGLIWIDAHLDAHTFETSPSGNLHGMPVAALLGQGDERLRQVYRSNRFIHPKNLVLVGAHSFELSERNLLERLGVSWIPMGPGLEGTHLADVLERVYEDLAQRCGHVGISIDLDAVDPEDAPGVGSPVSRGLSGEDLCAGLQRINGDERLVGVEISEFNPTHDVDQRTEELVARMVSCIYGD